MTVILNPSPITLTADRMWIYFFKLTPDKVVFKLQPCGDTNALDGTKVISFTNTHEIYTLLVNEAKRITGFAQIDSLFLTAPFNKPAYLSANHKYTIDFWALYASDATIRASYDQILTLIGGTL